MISAEAKRVLLGRLGTEIASKVLRRVVGDRSSSRSPRGRRRRRIRRPPPEDDANIEEGTSIKKGRKKKRTTREEVGRRSAAAAAAVVVATEGGETAAASSATAAARCEVESVVRSRFVVGELVPANDAKMTGGCDRFSTGGGGNGGKV